MVFVSIRNSSQDMVLCLSVFWVLLEALLLHLFSIEGDISDQCLELWLLYLSVLFMKVWLAKKVHQAYQFLAYQFLLEEMDFLFPTVSDGGGVVSMSISPNEEGLAYFTFI